MRKLARLLLAAALVLGDLIPAFPQPAPVPALPDTPRITTYAIVAGTGPYDVGFAVYGDSTDYSNWLEVWLDSTKLTGITDWTLALTSGTVATAARPLTNAQITLTTARTGTLRIVGARRPRRTAQFAENRGVTARDLNQVITDNVARLREQWDLLARTILIPPGETTTVLPPAATRAGAILVFDGSGNATVAAPGVGTGNVLGPAASTSGHIAIFVGSTGTLLADGGAIGATTLTGDVTGGPSIGTIAATLASTGVSANTYGSSALIPVLAIDAKGRITLATSAAVTPGSIGAVPTTRLVSTGSGLTGGGDLSADRTLSFANISSAQILANITGGSQPASGNTLSDIIDAAIGSTQGTILHRTSSGWFALPVGASGQLLSSGGAGAQVSWITAAGTGTVTSVAAGTGLTAAPSPIVGAGTISLTTPVTVSLGGTGGTTFTNHGLLVGQTTSAFVALPAGTTGQCVASGGAAADPSYKTGCRTLLNTLSGPAAALTDTVSFTSTYSIYEIEFINIVAATSLQNCRLRVNAGGVQTATYLSAWYVGGSGAASTTFIPCSSTNNILGNAEPGISGVIRLYDPSSVLRRKMTNGWLSYLRNDGTLEPFQMTSYWNGSNVAITGIEISMSAGNITSGSVRIYGRP